jgi:hypothetical protein
MHFNPHSQLTIGTLVLALALGATAAAATARVGGPNAAGSLVSATSNVASPVVRPNPDEQTPATQARPATAPSAPSPTVHPNPDEQTAPGVGTGTVNVPPVVVHVSSPSGGFDWGDAGIGAAGGIALAMLGLGGALAASQRRTRRAGRSSALTS